MLRELCCLMVFCFHQERYPNYHQDPRHQQNYNQHLDQQHINQQQQYNNQQQNQVRNWKFFFTNERFPLVFILHCSLVNHQTFLRFQKLEGKFLQIRETRMLRRKAYKNRQLHCIEVPTYSTTCTLLLCEAKFNFIHWRSFRKSLEARQLVVPANGWNHEPVFRTKILLFFA